VRPGPDFIISAKQSPITFRTSIHDATIGARFPVLQVSLECSSFQGGRQFKRFEPAIAGILRRTNDKFLFAVFLNRRVRDCHR
jgi:hypothetical protein